MYSLFNNINVSRFYRNNNFRTYWSLPSTRCQTEMHADNSILRLCTMHRICAKLARAHVTRHQSAFVYRANVGRVVEGL